ncbi:hypothetical protein LBMAG53_09520 [Planctomycetota bacterium]|nr:hypothetical protein LBMAG53_09520 [Planctomycetota bacterium]
MSASDTSRTTLILGCGALGAAVAERLRRRGIPVLGVRRSGGAGLLAGDAAEPELYQRLPLTEITSVLLAASPGLRRGRDNRLAAAVTLITRFLPAAHLVYSGTTAVYADAGGGDADESASLIGEGPGAGLVAIEQAVLAHQRALVLRFPALVGAQRRHARDRVEAALAAAVPCVVAGDPDRPFSYCHDEDAADLCALAATGGLAVEGNRVLNAAAPDRMTVRGYYQGFADQILAGQPAPAGFTIVGDGSAQPRRRIDAGRLHHLLPDWRWRRP